MLAVVPQLVCNVIKLVVPGCMMKVMTSLATPPTMKTGDCVPIPVPMLFTWTEYPGAAPFVVQYTRKSWFDVQLAIACSVPGESEDMRI